MKPSEQKRLPCPFCGFASSGHHITKDTLCLVCSECDASGPYVEGAAEEETTWAEAIAAWNRRSTVQPTGEPVAGQHVAYFDDGQFHWMSGIAPRNGELYAAPVPAATVQGAVVLPLDEAKAICKRLEYDASWDKCGHGYYRMKRALSPTPDTASAEFDEDQWRTNMKRLHETLPRPSISGDDIIAMRDEQEADTARQAPAHEEDQKEGGGR